MRNYASFGRWALLVKRIWSPFKGGATVACLLSSFLLFSTRYVRNNMEFWCMFFMRVLMLVFGILRLSNFSMDRLWMVPLTPTVIVIRGFVFQPLFRIVLISGSYFACFCVRACSEKLSWHYVNLMSCIVCVREGIKGVIAWFGAPSMHMISGIYLAWHWKSVCGQVHSKSHFGTICSWVLSLRLPTFVNV